MCAQLRDGEEHTTDISSRRELARGLKSIGFEVDSEALDKASRSLRDILSRGGAVTRRTLRVIAADAGLSRAN